VSVSDRRTSQGGLGPLGLSNHKNRALIFIMWHWTNVQVFINLLVYDLYKASQ
jgi:hypothetical protein